MLQKHRILLILVFLFRVLPLWAQDNKETGFKKACDVLLKGFIKEDLKTVNSLINPKQGVYLLYRTGLMDEYMKMKKMEGEHPLKFEYFDLEAPDLKKYSLQYGKIPTYDCEAAQTETGGWSRRGYFADTVRKYTPVSSVVYFRVKFMEERISHKGLQAIISMERISRKVVFTGKSGDGIIFYLMYLNGKWWLSVIDRLTMDCSA